MTSSSSAWMFWLLAMLSACRDQNAEARVAEPPGVVPIRNEVSAPSSSAGLRLARLVAKHPLGVPLHPEPGSSTVSGRLPDGSSVHVEEQRLDGRWLRIRALDGVGGWVTRRYVSEASGAPSSRPGPAPAPSSLPKDSPWTSREACEEQLKKQSGMARAARTARIGSWNLHWFPDGGPGTRARADGTDITWLACAIVWLDVDVLAVQEMKTHAAGRDKLAQLLTELDRKKGGKWLAELDQCPNAAGQHVGLIYDSSRARASGWQTYESMNAHGLACKDQLRPGFGGYFRFPGGLDLHIVAVHLKSGGERRSLDLRERALLGVGALWQKIQALEPDDDVLLAGDFNTMGCPDCSPSVSAERELEAQARVLAGLSAPFRRVRASLPCSQYFDGRASLLDHFVASSKMRELAQERSAEVSGICEVSVCGALATSRMPPAYDKLSDHCPIVLELSDRDLD